LRFINLNAAQTPAFVKAAQAQVFCKRLNSIITWARLKRNTQQKPLNSNRFQSGGLLLPNLFQLLLRLLSPFANAALALFALQTFAFVFVKRRRDFSVSCMRDGVQLW
jgi:hypothetical protein